MTVGIVLNTPAQALNPQISEKKLERLLVPRTPEAAKAHAAKQMAKYGWNKPQYACLLELWRRESNWRPNAFNKTPVYQIIDGVRTRLHAGGIPQKLGLNPKLSVQKQIKAGLDYIQFRYSTPCKALHHHDQVNWY